MSQFYDVALFLSLTAFLIFFGSVTTEQVKLAINEFQIKKDVNMCDDVVFMYENITQDASCMIKCAQNASCNGVFSDPPTGRCVACFKAGKNNGHEQETPGTYFENISKSSAPVVLKCEEPWFGFQGHCYMFTKRQTYQEGMKQCKKNGGQIAVIENDAENQFLRQKAQEQGGRPFYTTGVVSDPAVLTGEWYNINTNTSVSFLPWHAGEPNNSPGQPRCATLHPITNYEWADEHCQERLFLFRVFVKNEIYSYKIVV